MIKKLILLSLLGLSSYSALAQTPGHYVGGKMGFSSFSGLGDVPFTNVKNTMKKNNFGAGFFYGYQFNPNVAVEVGYDWLGRFKNAFTEDNFSKSSVTGRGQGLSLSAKLGAPITEKFDLYGKIGAFVNFSSLKNNNSSLKKIKDKTKVSPLLAVGGSYLTDKNIGVRLEYQWLVKSGEYSVSASDLTKTKTYKPNNGVVSLGVFYKFQ